MKILAGTLFVCREDLRSTSVGLRIILDISFPHTLHPMYQKILWASIWKIYLTSGIYPLPSPSGQSQHESSSGFPVPSLFLSLQCLLLCSLAEALTPSLTLSPADSVPVRASFCFWDVYSSFPTSRSFHMRLASSLGHTFP